MRKILLLAAVLAVAAPAMGASYTYVWNASTSSDWATAANWTALYDGVTYPGNDGGSVTNTYITLYSGLGYDPVRASGGELGVKALYIYDDDDVDYDAITVTFNDDGSGDAEYVKARRVDVLDPIDVTITGSAVFRLETPVMGNVNQRIYVVSGSSLTFTNFLLDATAGNEKWVEIAGAGTVTFDQVITASGDKDNLGMKDTATLDVRGFDASGTPSAAPDLFLRGGTFEADAGAIAQLDNLANLYAGDASWNGDDGDGGESTDGESVTLVFDFSGDDFDQISLGTYDGETLYGGNVVIESDAILELQGLAGGPNDDIYDIITFEGSLTGTFASVVNNTGVDLDATFGVGGVNYGDGAIQVKFVPEPATMALLGLGGLGVLVRRKRR